MADSLYYLLGGLEPAYEKAYRKAMSTAIDQLLFRPMLPNNANV